MALSHISKVFAVNDAKIYPLTADPSGGAATYGSAIDVPGIKNVLIGGTIDSKDLRGDNTLIDSDSALVGLTAKVEFAKWQLDIMKNLFGTAAVADTGAAPNQKSSLSIVGGVAAATGAGVSQPGYFKLEAQTLSTDNPGGDAHLVLYKAKLGVFPEIGFRDEDYSMIALELKLMPLISTGAWLDIVWNQTAVAIV